MPLIARRCFAFSLAITSLSSPLRAQSLQVLAADFWQWRAREQPFSTDDIPRVERSADFVVDWSKKSVAAREAQLAVYERRWKQLAPSTTNPIAQQVDYRLLGSAIARVRWEEIIQQSWRRNPQFYVDQTLSSVVILLLQPPPFSPERQRELVLRTRQIPATIQAAETNLTDIRAPFAELAITNLGDLAERVHGDEAGLAPQLSDDTRKNLLAAIPAALAALEQYRTWLETKLPTASAQTAIGRKNYLYFLRNVALMLYTPEQLLAISRPEWARSVAFESYQQQRLANSPPAPIFATSEAQIAAETSEEQKIRDFLKVNHLLTIPAWMPHYHFQPLPAYLVPLDGITEADDFTGPSRVHQDATRYIVPPRPTLGFFSRSMAQDPVPSPCMRAFPATTSSSRSAGITPDPIRRQYYDSSANEGIGFYTEEMLLQAGLFDDDPHTRQTIFSFMRLRALRVEVDVKLALGQFTLGQAADYLERTVPTDHTTALAEAALFASTPGQAISYQIGKVQINELLADTRRAQGNSFSLLRFHDFLWNNGNLPISLQRWELLEDPSELPIPLWSKLSIEDPRLHHRRYPPQSAHALRRKEWRTEQSPNAEAARSGSALYPSLDHRHQTRTARLVSGQPPSRLPLER